MTFAAAALLANCDSCEMRKRNERFLVAKPSIHLSLFDGEDTQDSCT